MPKKEKKTWCFVCVHCVSQNIQDVVYKEIALGQKVPSKESSITYASNSGSNLQTVSTQSTVLNKGQKKIKKKLSSQMADSILEDVMGRLKKSGISPEYQHSSPQTADRRRNSTPRSKPERVHSNSIHSGGSSISPTRRSLLTPGTPLSRGQTPQTPLAKKRSSSTVSGSAHSKSVSRRDSSQARFSRKASSQQAVQPHKSSVIAGRPPRGSQDQVKAKKSAKASLVSAALVVKDAAKCFCLSMIVCLSNCHP